MTTYDQDNAQKAHRKLALANAARSAAQYAEQDAAEVYRLALARAQKLKTREAIDLAQKAKLALVQAQKTLRRAKRRTQPSK